VVGRLAVAGALLAAVALAGARWDYTADDTLIALDAASSRARCVVGYETGWTFDPNLVGRAGEQGAAQLHPRGKLPEFYAAGYTDPWSPYQAVEYLDAEIAAGHGSAWTPILYGYC
jgi:hypothetical protein